MTPPRWILEKLGLVKDGVLTIPLLADFILSMKQSSSEVIQYDAVTNEIRKGGIVLSDSLTSSEFKLLKLLLENPDKIIERDEIIKASGRMQNLQKE